jgi:hypothetical protein
MIGEGREARVAALLHQAGETHHVVYAISDGADEDWATWYSDWLTRLSELPDVLGRTPVRSALTAALVELDREYTAAAPPEPWESYYARALVSRFAA